MMLDTEGARGKIANCGDWHPGKIIKALRYRSSKWVCELCDIAQAVSAGSLILYASNSQNPPGLASRRFKESCIREICR